MTATSIAGAFGKGLSGGSLVSIFGMNLAASTEAASTVPLPTKLGGTSVAVNGVAAPLFFVSPGQINFQMPYCYGTCHTASPQGIVVSTAAGSSDPYLVDGQGAEGLFTSDASGCGQGAILNVRADGSVSVNSTANGAAPGDSISIFGTGLGIVSNPPPDGMPAQSAPLSASSVVGDSKLDSVDNPPVPGSYWAGRAPGLIGVDQFNFLVPDTTREGCAVPLQVVALYGISQAVTVSIRKGGGPCVDPPSAGFGQIAWEKSVTTSTHPTVGSTTETDTLTVSLQSSPGKQAPATPAYTEGGLPGAPVYFGPSCPVSGYRSLDAGRISTQAPGSSPVPASVMPLTGPVSNLTVYQTMLPNRSIHPGTFSVSAMGGGDVGPFQSSVQIGSEIHITTVIAGRLFDFTQPVTVNWTGGDPASWVTFTIINHYGYEDVPHAVRARTSAGTATIGTVAGHQQAAPGLVSVVLEVDPDPSQIAAFAAPGLSLGGRHTWKYTYRFEDVMVQ
ncbi:MAG: hypothetical protein LAQ69_47880 [Acidobacteriia bacterium]|nr:hypothetical protein [Terriglobia bacterium]